MENSLNKAITATASLILLLQLDKFEFAERFEDVLQITFSDAEMNITHIKSMEWDLVVRVAGSGFSISNLAVFLGLRELSDYGNPEELLSRELNSGWNRFLILELNIANSVTR